MEDTTTHKKIVVFDLNLDLNSNKQEESKYKHLPLVYKVMHDAAQYQTIVIQTTNGLSDGINFVRNQNITKGYLIASCGAIIYDITNNKIIDSIPHNNNVVYTIVHHGIMSNVNVGIYTADKKFIFVSDNVGYNVNKDNSYGPYDVIPSYDLLTKTLTRTDIVDVSYFTYYGKFDKQFTEQLIGSLNHYWDSENKTIKINQDKASHYVHICDKNATMVGAIGKIMAIEKINSYSDVLYIAGTGYDDECFINFVNSLIPSNSEYIAIIGNKNHRALTTEVEKLDPEFGLHSNSFWK